MELEMNDNKQLKLMVVVAHPDDETFGMGGTLAMYARNGVDVHLVCATRGEAGMMDAEYLQGFSSIAERRESELRCAAEMLGIKDVHFLDYRDSGMQGSPDNRHPDSLVSASEQEIIGDIVHYIRKIKPQVVITFDPIGGYRHPDHIAVQKATEKAFYAAGNPEAYPVDLPPFSPEKLYFHTMPKTLLRWMVRLMPLFGKDPRKFGKNEDINLLDIAEADFPVHAVINYKPVSELRDEASACHASQGGAEITTSFFSRIRRMNMNKDTFMRAYPQPDNGHVEKDLFEGIAEEKVLSR